MTGETDILIAMQEVIRKALSEAANEEIDRLVNRFECKMGEVKIDMIGKILNNIDIVTSNDPSCNGYTIQVNVKR